LDAHNNILLKKILESEYKDCSATDEKNISGFISDYNE